MFELCSTLFNSHSSVSLQNEHFGVVPLEAMAASRPVIACASGGPTESIVHGETGFLCQPTPEAFASAADSLLKDVPGALCICPLRALTEARSDCVAAAERAGMAARARVERLFSRRSFGEKLNEVVTRLVQGGA